MKSVLFRAVQPVWGNVYMCYDYVRLDNFTDASAYRNHNVQQCKMQIPSVTNGLKSCLLSALHKSLYVYDSVVNSILNRTFKIRKV